MSDPQHPLVSTITASAFARVGVSKTFQRGETICREGDPGSVMLVHSGLVDVRSQIDETDVSVATLGSGRLIEDLTVMEGGIRSAMMVARTDVQLLLVDPLTMSDLLEREPGVALDVLRSMVDRLRSRAAQPLVLSKDARSLGRIIVEHLDQSGTRWGLMTVAEVPAGDLAVETMFEPQRFAAALNELQTSGLVASDANRVAVGDRAALGRTCREPVI